MRTPVRAFAGGGWGATAKTEGLKLFIHISVFVNMYDSVCIRTLCLSAASSSSKEVILMLRSMARVILIK